MGSLLLAVPRLLPAGSTGTAGLYMPQGSTAGTPNGDYISDSGGLNTFYRYFIEVPPGLTRLVVSLFDADVGAGGGTEDTAGRDRTRNANFESVATYSLVNPAGVAQTTLFTTGDAAGPAGSDNAWLSLFDSTAVDDYRDNFETVAYNNSDGSLPWTTSWIETNDNNAANNGQIQITGGELRLGDNGGALSTIERQADLAAFGGAILTFDRRTTGVDAGDQFRVEVSATGGAPWTTLETWNGALADAGESYDISAHRSANTRVRFIHVTGYGNNDFLFIDDFRIRDTQVAAGHWELRVDMAAGDDINALGLRAHDGTAGSGGTEINVYFDSFTQFGVNPSNAGAATRNYDIYPYITAGCSAAKNDFDYDSNNGTVGQMEFRSRTGAYTEDFNGNTPLSTNNVWRRDSFTGWTSDVNSTDNGIWPSAVSISTYNNENGLNGNYTTFYMSNQLATANPPGGTLTNPMANAFRVYLPTDAVGTPDGQPNAATAPLKPYLEQQLRHDLGPNPPAVGQMSTYMVTVRVVNPTARAITFSSSNLVTANVPGGGAVYGGAAQVTQGTIVSQPAVGNTGNITWNPGTVAAGETELLAYAVRITPAAAGQRITATATPASGNGTRATWVDETGNPSQARATFTFGPLCELAVTQGLLTHAVVSSFRTFADERGGVRAEWTTASEVGTAGFRLLRWNGRRYVPVHEGLLPGLVHAAQGGTYRFHDGGAAPGQPQVYLLEEIEADGDRRAYGPFAGMPQWERSADAERRAAYEREAHPTLRKAVSEAQVRPAAAFAGPAGSEAGVHLSIRETGLYYVTSEQLASWLGVTADRAGKLIVQGQLSLTRGGQPVAFFPEPAERSGRDVSIKPGLPRGFYFYGEVQPNLYSLDTVYRLQEGAGPVMQTRKVPRAAAASGGSFPESTPFESDVIPATAISPDPESDYWFWDFVISGDPDLGRRTFTFDAPALVPSGDATVAVSLHGATDNATPGEHVAAVTLNGAFLGEAQWQGIAPHTAAFAVPAGFLQETGNQLEIFGTVGNGAPFSFYFVDGFEIGYPRRFEAADDALTFTGGGSSQVTVTGFSDAAVRLLDVSNPLQPRWIAGAAVEADPSAPSGTFRASFVPSPLARYFAAGPGALKTPLAVRAWSPDALLDASNRADVLIVVPAGMESAAERLAAHRRSQGLEAVVASLDAVADLFGHGTATPNALRSFLAHAATAWTVRPRYLVLVGEGTLDYRNLQGFGDSVMPPLLIQAEGGLFPSDNRLADVDGDGRPDLAAGRIPVLTAAELDAYIDKILAYESAGEPAWAANVLMLADSPDGGASFPEDSDRIASHLSAGYEVDRIYLDSEPLAQARTRLLQGIAEGASLIDFVGHGGLDRLSADGLLTSADVPDLANGERLPVLTAMTCTVNRFAVPGVPSLGELLVKSPDGGAAAVWGPSGLSFHGEARHLAGMFYRQAGSRGGRLGDWILQSMNDFRALGGDGSMLDIYNLLGDPSLVVRRGPAPVPSGGSGSE